MNLLRVISVATALMTLTATLAACGQKGPLTLPPPPAASAPAR
ncbi:MAG TPA: lipoprotein [Burkholderiaceae bacterium]|nr:lipoprotein [Burkholderiaceae bacterium]